MSTTLAASIAAVNVPSTTTVIISTTHNEPIIIHSPTKNQQLYLPRRPIFQQAQKLRTKTIMTSTDVSIEHQQQQQQQQIYKQTQPQYNDGVEKIKKGNSKNYDKQRIMTTSPTPPKRTPPLPVVSMSTPGSASAASTASTASSGNGAVTAIAVVDRKKIRAMMEREKRIAELKQRLREWESEIQTRHDNLTESGREAVKTIVSPTTRDKDKEDEKGAVGKLSSKHMAKTIPFSNKDNDNDNGDDHDIEEDISIVLDVNLNDDDGVVVDYKDYDIEIEIGSTATSNSSDDASGSRINYNNNKKRQNKFRSINIDEALVLNYDLALQSLGEGPMTFAPDPKTERSFHDQLHTLSPANRKCVENLIKRWRQQYMRHQHHQLQLQEQHEQHDQQQQELLNNNSNNSNNNHNNSINSKLMNKRLKSASSSYFPLSNQWILRFARNNCTLTKSKSGQSHNLIFHEKRAWKAMRKFKQRYLKLSIFQLEEQLRTKTLFPVPGLRTSQGHEMFYMKPSRYHPKHTTTKMIIDNLAYVMNCMIQTSEAACRDGIGFIANMNDWMMENFNVNYCFQFMMCLQGFMVPVKVELFLIVNPPKWFGAIWKIMKPMLAPSFRRKVKVILQNKLHLYLQDGYEQYMPNEMFIDTSATTTRKSKNNGKKKSRTIAEGEQEDDNGSSNSSSSSSNNTSEEDNSNKNEQSHFHGEQDEQLQENDNDGNDGSGSGTSAEQIVQDFITFRKYFETILGKDKEYENDVREKQEKHEHSSSGFSSTGSYSSDISMGSFDSMDDIDIDNNNNNSNSNNNNMGIPGLITTAETTSKNGQVVISPIPNNDDDTGNRKKKVIRNKKSLLPREKDIVTQRVVADVESTGWRKEFNPKVARDLSSQLFDEFESTGWSERYLSSSSRRFKQDDENNCDNNNNNNNNNNDNSNHYTAGNVVDTNEQEQELTQGPAPTAIGGDDDDDNNNNNIATNSKPKSRDSFTASAPPGRFYNDNDDDDDDDASIDDDLSLFGDCGW